MNKRKRNKKCIALVIELDADKLTKRQAEALMTRSIAMDCFKLAIDMTFFEGSVIGHYVDMDYDKWEDVGV